MKRPSYSVYWTFSPLHEKYLTLPSRLMQHLIIWAETTPGIEHYELSGPSYAYGEGLCKTTPPIPLTVQDDKGCIEYWDFSPGGSDAQPSEARQVQEANASHEGIRLFVLHERDIYRRPTELRNRLHAHALLSQGFGVDTSKEEAALLVESATEAKTLEQLRHGLSMPASKALLVFLRCWLRGRLRWEIESHPLSVGLMVER